MLINGPVQGIGLYTTVGASTGTQRPQGFCSDMHISDSEPDSSQGARAKFLSMRGALFLADWSGQTRLLCPDHLR